MKTICFYHNADLDGQCSGAIVKYFVPEAELYGYDYHLAFDWSKINPETTVYMVDVSLSYQDMLKLKSLCKKLIYIDHHISKLRELKSGEFSGLQVDGVAACELCWKWFEEKKPLPFGVHLLARYDIWDLNDKVLAFQHGIRQCNTNPDQIHFWRELFETPSVAEAILSIGKNIYEYVVSQNKRICKSTAFFITEDTSEDLDFWLEKYNILAANVSHQSSLFFKDHPRVDEADILLTFSKMSNQSWKFSLYTEKADVDVSVIAKSYGGGGHKQAAGFTCRILPDELSNFIISNYI